VTRVYYTKTIGGRLYPKARREGKNVAYCNDVHREGRSIINEYIGILEVPKGKKVSHADRSKSRRAKPA
jgi:hypothetical protein